MQQKMITINQELYSSKNSRQFVRLKTGRTVLIKSHRAQEQEATLDEALKQNLSVWKDMIKDKPFPLEVHFSIKRATRRRWDWANILQGLADAMVKAGYIPDDDAAHFKPVYEDWSVDKENPSVSFWV